MRTLVRMGRAVAVCAMIGMIGCTSVEHSPSPPLERIAVTDFASVAGEWEGLMEQTPPARYDNWVHLTIHPDGAFHFEAYRTMGVFSRSGTFHLEDGTLVATTEKGKVAAKLYRHAGKNDRVVRTEGTTGDGIIYHAELTPARRR